MVLFNISGSEKLWKISGGCGCGPEFTGIRSKIEADDWKDALFRTMLSMELEWTYNLTGEWIEAEHGGERHRFLFKSNPETRKYIGDFEHNGKKYRGVEVNPEDDGKALLPSAGTIIDIVDPVTGYGTESHLSEFMPKCIVDAVLESMD